MQKKKPKPKKIKIERFKFFLDAKAMKAYKVIIRLSKAPYKIIMSNYTTRIICPLLDIDFMFVNSFQSDRMFIAYAMIKRDFEKWSANEMPTTEYKDVVFYENKITKNINLENIVNLDLNSAYATALLNTDFIQENTYNYLQLIPKIDRLSCVGMFASKKTTYHFDEKGEIVLVEPYESPTSGYFIYCIKIVGELMMKIKDAIGADFLMFWVDGIYIINNPESVNKAKEIIEENKFKYKEKLLPIFQATIDKKKRIKIRLGEEKENLCEIKEFNYPATPTEFQKDFENFVNSFIN